MKPGLAVSMQPEPSAQPGAVAVDRDRTTATVASLLEDPPMVALTSSCTHALEAAAGLLEITTGDEVIVPAFNFPSAANAFLLRGASVRFADVDPRTGNVDPARVGDAITERTRAVLCMHYGGVAADLEVLDALVGQAGCHLVEDAAHGLFARWRSRPLGTFGTVGAFSFHRTKNISAHEGGAIAVNDPALADRLAPLLDKGTNREEFTAGLVDSYEWVSVGSAWRMPEPLVGMLEVQLEHRFEIQRRRHAAWDAYFTGLSTWAEQNEVQLPTVPHGAEHPAHIFWLLLPDRIERARFVEHCRSGGVETARHFGSLPESRQGRRLGADPARFPVAGRFAHQLVRLPLHHQLGAEDTERVLEVVSSFR